jgi:multicomponent Na+:H+ antiporter subunit G
MHTVVIILVLAGTFFFATATLGLLRFPDFYTRMHATGKGDTLGAFLSFVGLALYTLLYEISLDTILVSIKLMFIAIFIFVANPTATHALTKAGLDCNVEPWTKGDASK